jgi:hypothetical protein
MATAKMEEKKQLKSVQQGLLKIINIILKKKIKMIVVDALKVVIEITVNL